MKPPHRVKESGGGKYTKLTTQNISLRYFDLKKAYRIAVRFYYSHLSHEVHYSSNSLRSPRARIWTL